MVKLCVGDFSVSLEMAERGDLSDVRRGVFSGPLWVVRFPLAAGCLWPPFRPATHLLNGDGQAREVLCFFLFEGCLLAFGDWGLGMDLRL